MVRTITEKARSMIISACMDKIFWGDAVLTATYLIDITPTRALKQTKTPYEMWHGKKPQIKYLKIFGSTVFVHNKNSRTKFDDKSWKGILVGYESNGYKVWDVEREKYAIVRDVIVDELDFIRSRPIAKCEGVNKRNSEDKTDVSDKKSKSVEGQVSENISEKNNVQVETDSAGIQSKSVVDREKSDNKKILESENRENFEIKLGGEYVDFKTFREYLAKYRVGRRESLTSEPSEDEIFDQGEDARFTLEESVIEKEFFSETMATSNVVNVSQEVNPESSVTCNVSFSGLRSFIPVFEGKAKDAFNFTYACEKAMKLAKGPMKDILFKYTCMQLRENKYLKFLIDTGRSLNLRAAGYIFEKDVDKSKGIKYRCINAVDSNTFGLTSLSLRYGSNEYTIPFQVAPNHLFDKFDGILG
ncbi:unnamed protein product [Hermetia illucens]|uniref:Retroviral polymerase SH3-like domain-containing protein n=1 Tax=Hermetia illucens TaxID=343691 RepID=A0A7R8V0T8_HERIL|nr:unnamed protein product [Hermetia illucens]